MRVSYNKLWRLMKANRMTKKELTAAADITNYAMSKMNSNQTFKTNRDIRYRTK